MRIETAVRLDYDDVLLRPKRSTISSRQEVDLRRQFKFKYAPDKGRYTYVPIVAANMDGVGTFDMAYALSDYLMLTALSKHYSIDEFVEFFDNQGDGPEYPPGIYTMGATDADLSKFKSIRYNMNRPLWVCVDVANGYTEKFLDFVARFRDENPERILVAGNVATPDITSELVLRGADVVKVGIGPGAVCTTRLVAGVGVPQLSAVAECADAAHGLGAHVMADGGCKHPGDVAKAFAAGADFVMLGSMLAGTKQGGIEPVQKYYDGKPGELPGEMEYRTKEVVKFYGMSSKTANEKHFGGMRDYRASEGREVEIDYKGDVSNAVQEILGGLRSACAYVGAQRLKDLPKCATFVRCNSTHNKTYE